MNDFSIVIQGPINEISLSNIDNYKKFGHVILSCYENDENKVSHIEVEKVYNKLPSTPFANFANQGLHAISTIGGLLLVKTKYVIKVRSDEKYENLQPVMDAVVNNLDKWISHNIWFKKSTLEWLHPGDHLIAGSTDLLLNAFITVRDWAISLGNNQRCWTKNDVGINAPIYQLFPENVFFLGFLKSMYGDELNNYINSKSARDIMLQHSYLVNINSLGQYLWSFTNMQGQREYLDNTELAFNWHGSPAIQSMEEI